MFKERLISGIILVIIALITGIIGGPIFCLTTLCISLIGLKEMYAVGKVDKRLPGIVGYGFSVAYFVLLYYNLQEFTVLLSLIFLVAVLGSYVFSFPEFKASQIILVFFGFFYVTIMLSYLYQCRTLVTGQYTMWLVFLSSWGCDTCAYCVGVLFGKNKLAPILSPKKSVEGAVGGVLGAALLGGLYAVAINTFTTIEVEPIVYALICAIGGMISMIGDLAASGIKRDHNIKDYGTLIPGHGGILDRFDSVIFTAPIIYYLAFYLM